MAEYSREDVEQALGLVRQLLDGDAEDINAPEDVAILDVEEDARTFSDDLALLDEIDADVPALVLGDGEAVPVSLAHSLGLADRPSPFGPRPSLGRSPRAGRFFRDAIQQMLREYRATDGMAVLPRRTARDGFVRRGAEFLATRIAFVRKFREGFGARGWNQGALLSIRQWRTGPRVNTPGCHFVVSTNSHGLRVLWSGAYFVTPNSFAYPTSPASNVLQAGTYIFGVDGGAYGNSAQWDHNAVVSLPGPPSVHLHY